jgi:choline-sulfatase
VDELLGAFFDRLDERGLLGDTLVVVTSDHGDEFYEHGGVDHIHTLYDELIRVPLIVFGPGVPQRVVHEHVAQMDLYPTLCDLMGVPCDAAIQAASQAEMLAPSFESAEPPPGIGHPVYSFTGFSEYPYRISSVRTDQWKLKVWSLAGMKDVKLAPDRPRYTYKFRPETEDFVELFDLRSDPGEHLNLADRHPEIAQQLARMLQDRIEASRAFAHPPENAPAPDLDYIEALKDLVEESPSTSSQKQANDE